MYYRFLAMLSHCFTGLCGVTVCFAHTNGFASEVNNSHDIIFLKFTNDVDDAYRQNADCLIRKKQFRSTIIDVQFTFGKTFAMSNPFLDT